MWLSVPQMMISIQLNLNQNLLHQGSLRHFHSHRLSLMVILQSPSLRYYSKLGSQKLIRNQLFFSTHSEYLPANKIQVGIKILTFEEYSDLEFEEETIFFSRAAIDLDSMEPRPNIKLWKKSCVCQLPQNPDLQMIQCDECDNWYHLDCVELQDQDITKIDKYLCPRCNK
ncbi:unnamed protein product (macronuclear) [Paramecium tetraurelia]|uniref:PHD-type domain-containing protein n=1 Tax=Paramecium tetraurelia TaxID=5888 RepID=A0CGM3_PARTE|nr:uncharacterized protein GSPATT00007380001 [Paramecium tetraurelia]CAK69940.1 unnamed protein product [Paramecium tetraurelia]|eukprot:XP_001437337.1 hypothetical protein (macronuclear) [Paramecium tetraurelia strain d4-2]